MYLLCVSTFSFLSCRVMRVVLCFSLVWYGVVVMWYRVICCGIEQAMEGIPTVDNRPTAHAAIKVRTKHGHNITQQ